MTGSSYFFEKVDSLGYNFHKVTLKRVVLIYLHLNG